MQKRIARLFGEAMIPDMFLNASASDYPQDSKLLSDAIEATDTGQGLMIWGRRGTGKTHLAMAMLNRRIGEGVPGLYVYVPDLLSRIRDSYSGVGPSAYTLVEAVKAIDVLLLDDLDKERPTEWVKEQLNIIINHRYAWKKQTFCTMNASRKILEAHIGDAPVSRLGQMCRWLHLVGRDRRTENNNQEVEHANA